MIGARSHTDHQSRLDWFYRTLTRPPPTWRPGGARGRGRRAAGASAALGRGRTHGGLLHRHRRPAPRWEWNESLCPRQRHRTGVPAGTRRASAPAIALAIHFLVEQVQPLRSRVTRTSVWRVGRRNRRFWSSRNDRRKGFREDRSVAHRSDRAKRSSATRYGIGPSGSRAVLFAVRIRTVEPTVTSAVRFRRRSGGRPSIILVAGRPGRDPHRDSSRDRGDRFRPATGR